MSRSDVGTGADVRATVPRDLTAVVPVRDAADLLPGCLRSLADNGVRNVIVVDGLSRDRSREIAAEHGARVLSDDGRGLPWARTVGVRAATTRWVLLVDSDVVFPAGAVDALLAELLSGRYDALQAGLESVGGPGYWGRALARHHLTGRSRHWFGLVATLLERDMMVEVGFDDRFRSGEDIELRWRLGGAGKRTGVSTEVVVQHRFAGDTFAFALDQFLMDGFGLGRMVRKHRWRGLRLMALPAAASARGILLSLWHREPQWIPYYAAFLGGNYVGMARGLGR